MFFSCFLGKSSKVSFSSKLKITKGVRKSRREETSTVSVSAAAQHPNMMIFNNANPTVISIIDEENMRVKVEKKDKNGTKNNPILVTPFLNDRQGNKNEPICLEDDIKVMGDCNHPPICLEDDIKVMGDCNHPPICLEDDIKVMGDCNHPISVDDYQSSDVPEVIRVELAISNSMIDLDCFEVEPNDPKGKRPIIERKSRRSIREVGESSNSVLQEPDAYCSICMEPKFLYECFSMKNCSHLYCSSCVSQYVEAKVEENVTSIGCPDPSCNDGYLEPEMCRYILNPETFNRWGTALCEAMIGSMKFYCPFKDCSALLIDERVVTCGEVIMESECPHCNRLFCAQCKVPWHFGVTCEDFAKLGADERGIEDLMLKNMAKNCQWQRCPKCKYYVERVSGCMFIKCRCGFQFCYGCATEMKMDHYCKKCQR